ncbi:hypothetical protein VST7929_00463 [Vibrio stylophorae]|uniref:DUF1107 domain-containing protein n=1 Tax=Vibrio stylophorae TaxID=659351 RepID=A0ABN8DQH7_9VIBR|nr:DUF1107 family protein [Vibrio stylophorae]CAH0532623.1 hypothetical protein VST7929_00463 [Vibrio stylophorae]
MREFQRYLPKLIAKHVTRLFAGDIYIQGLGQFHFAKGKLEVPQQAELDHYRAVKEINGEIKRLKLAA